VIAAISRRSPGPVIRDVSGERSPIICQPEDGVGTALHREASRPIAINVVGMFGAHNDHPSGWVPDAERPLIYEQLPFGAGKVLQ